MQNEDGNSRMWARERFRMSMIDRNRFGLDFLKFNFSRKQMIADDKWNRYLHETNDFTEMSKI